MPEREIIGWYVKVTPPAGKPIPPLYGYSGEHPDYPPYTKEEAEALRSKMLAESGILGGRRYRDEEITLVPIYGPQKPVGLGSNFPPEES